MRIIPSPALKSLTRSLRWALVMASVLALITGFQLFVLTEQTDRYFSWTITSPLMAAFLGAAYWGNTIMFFLASREPLWARVRVVVPSIFAFTLLIPIATLFHLNLFHLGSSNVVTFGVTWLWIVIYAILPPVALGLVVWQRRATGGDPPREVPLPLWMHVVLGIHTAVTVVLGVALFLVPPVAIPLWPWQLTPLTAQVVGAFLLTTGVTAAQAIWENDWRRIRVAMSGYIALSLFYLLALARYLAMVTWSRLSAWLLLLFLLSMFVVGLYGWLTARWIDRQAEVVTAS